MKISPRIRKISRAESKPEKVSCAKRIAGSRPSFAIMPANKGTKAALKAPSAKSVRNRFGRRRATKKASLVAPAPSAEAVRISRTKPSTRLTMV